MSKTHSSCVNDSRDNESSPASDKELEESSKSPQLGRRQQTLKGGFKSLTTLTAKDSLENLQKLRRRNEARRNLRGSANSKERAKKKYTRKKFDKPHVSEANIRKDKLEVEGINKKLITIISPRNLQNNHGKPNHTTDGYSRTLEKLSGTEDNDKDEGKSKSSDVGIADYFEKLRISDTEMLMQQKSEASQNPDEAKKQQQPVEQGSGDQSRQDDDEEYEDLEDYEETGMACSLGYDSKRRSVQWKREVDVIYYAGDARGGKVVRRENEPLMEESDQQARRKRFIQLALTKNLLTNVSACQLREPWLVVMPK